MIINTPIKISRGISLLGVLVTLMSFSLVSIIFFKWQTQQARQAKTIFQQVQIQRIIDNQHQRQWLHLECEQEVYQNQRRFFIQCDNGDVKVRAKIR